MRIGDIIIDFAAETLRDGTGSEVPLRAQSFAVLRHLTEQAGRTVPKDALMEAVWGNIAVTDDSLVQCIGDIRRALGDEARTILRTVPRRGYRLDAPGTPAAPDAAAAAGPPLVMVLPFVVPGTDRSLDHLGRGIAGDIITMLSRVGGVKVIARATSFDVAERTRDLSGMARDLGADFVLDGSVEHDGTDRLRITAELVETSGGTSVGTVRYDGRGQDPFALQDEIGARVIATLAGEVGMLNRAQYRTAWGRDRASLGEYDWYLRGHDLLLRLRHRETNDQAGAIFEEGLRHFPDSALLAVMLGWKHSLAAGFLWCDDPARELEIAGRLVRDVLARDDLTPQAAQYGHWLFARVSYQEHDPEKALAEARLALRLAPNDAFMVWALAQVSAEAAQIERASIWLERARYLAPDLDWLHAQTEANILRLEGRNAEALACYDRTDRLPPYHRLIRAILLVRLGRTEAARAAVRDVLVTAPSITRTLWRVSTRLADPAILAGELADLETAGLPD